MFYLLGGLDLYVRQHYTKQRCLYYLVFLLVGLQFNFELQIKVYSRIEQLWYVDLLLHSILATYNIFSIICTSQPLLV